MSNFRPLKFAGKVAIVTGSSSGIGEATVILLSQLGARVVVTGRSAENIRRVSKQCNNVSPFNFKALEIIADITIDEDIDRLVSTVAQEFGRIDILVNNAGASTLNQSINDPKVMETFDYLLKTDLRSVVYITKLVIPYLELTKGNIINVSSINAVKPISSFMIYSMTKIALNMFSKCLSLELGPKGIRVNTINPAAVRTNFFVKMGFNPELLDKVLDDHGKTYPLGRIGEPNDCSKVIAFLASDDASFITGAEIGIDGGSVWSSSHEKQSN